MLIDFFSSLIPKGRASSAKPPASESPSVLYHLETKQVPADLKTLHCCALQDDPTAIFELYLRYDKSLVEVQDFSLAYGIFMLLCNGDADGWKQLS